MTEDFQLELQELGLLPAEAQVYIALVRNGALGGSAIASVTGFPRSSVYLTLNSLLDKGLVEGGAGNGSRFSVVPPDKALPSLIVQEKEAISEREKIAARLGHKLSSILETADTAPDELIQVIRSPRGVAERYQRLQLEAERQIEGFVKAPLFVTTGNPAQEKAQRRGVHYRALYERAVFSDPAVTTYLSEWVAHGEEVRIYDGELPHKLVIFDRKRVLAHLSMPGDQMRTLYIQHPELAASLGVAFEALWAQSERLTVVDEKKSGGDTALIRVRKHSRNGQVSRPKK
ncbi:MAG TPA: helix-turn-helix domain-containing protein [Chthoniobacterales bacterium]|nr:helix-turn-helix domain-containing protein [Chthoniobacterales bacterium]